MPEIPAQVCVLRRGPRLGVPHNPPGGRHVHKLRRAPRETEGVGALTTPHDLDNICVSSRYCRAEGSDQSANTAALRVAVSIGLHACAANTFRASGARQDTGKLLEMPGSSWMK